MTRNLKVLYGAMLALAAFAAFGASSSQAANSTVRCKGAESD